jgi:predicted amidohydrolase
MSKTFKVACVQNCAGPDMEQSLDEATTLVRQAAEAGAQLIVLPEFFSCLKADEAGIEIGALPEPAHPALPRYRALARELGCWLQLGSLGISGDDAKVLNRGYLIDAQGEIVARYDKIHLFDVDLPNGESYRESASIHPGAQAVVAATPWGGLGLSICYDLRFPQLYRALAKAGAAFLTVPAAFARITGQAHWHVLLRARAIETGCYVFAPCQYGTHGGERATYGHSLIVDPWGRVLADGGEEAGYVIAEVDPAEVDKARGMIPALTHDRPFSAPSEGARVAEVPMARAL